MIVCEIENNELVTWIKIDDKKYVNDSRKGYLMYVK